VAPPADCWARTTAVLVGSDQWRPGQPIDDAAPGTFRNRTKEAFLACVQGADALMRRHRPVLDAARFAAEIAGLPRRNGVRAVRDVFSHARPRTDSLPETHLRLLLVDAGLPELVANHEITLEGKKRCLDLASPGLMVAVEYHGRHHTNEPAQVEDDIRRRAALHAEGWTTIDVLWEDMISPARLIARVRAVIAARA
jgi:very-short-patch-repair endonuclease